MIDISKPHACRNGLPASAIRHPGVGCDHLAIGTYSNDRIRPGLWALNNGGKWAGDDSSHGGCQQEDHPLDLVNVPEQRSVKVWINVYRERDGLEWFGHPCRTRDSAFSSVGGAERIACIEREMTFTIGEGLGETP